MVQHLKESSHAKHLLECARELGLPEDVFHLVPRREWPELLSAIESRFGDNLSFLWWHSNIPSSMPRKSKHIDDQTGFQMISHLVPEPLEPIWFVCENWGAVEPRGCDRMIVFEATAIAIEQVVGESYGFEYVLVSKDLDWMIGENHHDVVFAVGTLVANRLPMTE